MNSKPKGWFGQMLGLAENCKPKMIWSVILSVISISSGLVPFYCMYRVIGEFVAKTADSAGITRWCIIALAAFALKVACFSFSTALSHSVAYEVLESCVGKDLERTEYEPLFACAGESAEKQGKKGHFVTCDDYVSMSAGTGIVHIAPAFGEDDARIGRNYDLPFVQFVDAKGNMTAETPYGGMFVKDADPHVLKDLDAQGKLFAAPKFEHEYPHCWRCNSPLIYYARDSWFI